MLPSSSTGEWAKSKYQSVMTVALKRTEITAATGTFTAAARPIAVARNT